MSRPKLSKTDEKIHIYCRRNGGLGRKSYSIHEVKGYKNLKFVYDGEVVNGKTILKMCKERNSSKRRYSRKRSRSRSKKSRKSERMSDAEMKRECRRRNKTLVIRYTKSGKKYYLNSKQKSKAKIISLCRR